MAALKRGIKANSLGYKIVVSGCLWCSSPPWPVELLQQSPRCNHARPNGNDLETHWAWRLFEHLAA